MAEETPATKPLGKYRVVGRAVSVIRTETQDAPWGKNVVPIHETWTVGQEVEPTEAMLKSFPDRFQKVDGEDDPIYPEGPPPEVTGSSVGGVAQSEPLSERVSAVPGTPVVQPTPQVSGRRSAPQQETPALGGKASTAAEGVPASTESPLAPRRGSRTE